MDRAQSIAICCLLAGAVLLTSSGASAQITERQVLGWTAANDVVVHVVERGERMVDGVSKDYWVEATEVYGAAGTSTVYRHGEPVGPAPPWHANALPSPPGGEQLRTDLRRDIHSPANPTGTHRFAWYTRARIDKPDDRTFVCRLRIRVVVLAATTRRVHSVLDIESVGEPSRRQDEAFCPPLNVDPHWSADGRVGFALVKIGGEVHSAFVKLAEIDDLLWAGFTPSEPLAATLATATEAAAWRVLSAGDIDEADRQFHAAKLPGGAALGRAISSAKGATKAADAAYESSAKSPRDLILRAATYTAAGQGSRATKWIDEAVKGAQSYDELLGFAAIFAFADPNVANQLAVHALSHQSAADADTKAGWTLLAEGLLELGEYSKAEEALDKIEEQTPASLAARTILHLDRRQPKIAIGYAEDLLFQNPGDCRAYHVQGRLRAMAGDNADARALFEAATTCDPSQPEASFYAADFARLAGDLDRAVAGFQNFLRVTPPRVADQVRTLRREAAARWSKQLARDGVVLIDVSCRKGGAGFLCTGTLKNTSDGASGEVSIEVKARGKKVGSTTIAAIEPGATAPFGVSFDTKSLSNATVTAGRNAAERRANETSAR